MGYLGFLNLLLNATFGLTDSGGIQEETTFLQIPCIKLRENTERTITIKFGTNYLIGPDPEKGLATAFTILEEGSKTGAVPPLWDGNASKRIVNILIENGNL